MRSWHIIARFRTAAGAVREQAYDVEAETLDAALAEVRRTALAQPGREFIDFVVPEGDEPEG